MQKLEFENATRYYSPSGSGTETPCSDQSPYRRQSSAGSHYQEDKKCVQVTLDINDDSAFAHGLKPSKYEDPGKSLLGQGRSGRKSNSVLKRIASSVSSDLKRFASFASSSSSARTSPRPPLAPFRHPKYTAVQALKGLKFITKTDGVAGWLEVDKRFHENTTSNGFLHRSKFGVCVGIESTDFAEALFDALARKRNITGDTITKGELEEFWTQITDEDFFSRLQTFFAMVDRDADGRLNEVEVREIITLSASANKLENIRVQADEYAALIMETLDLYNDGYITIEALEVLLLEASAETIRDEESKDLSKILGQQLKASQNWNLMERVYRGMKYFVLDNWKRLWVIALWIGVMAGLFTWKFMEYRKRSAHQVMGACVCIAKGAGETLKLNMALILLPVCRNTITWLRTKTKLGVVVPFDDSLNFHKVIATAISIGVGIHATSHLACDFPRLLAADEETYKPMEQYFGVQAKSYGDFLKSVEVLTGTGMVILMTIAFTLATSWFRSNKIESLPQPLKKITGFNSFWYTHHLFIIVYSLLVVHGYYVYLIKTWYRKTTWMYLMVPGVIYLSERLIRVLRSRIEAVSILKVSVLPGNLLSLQMSRPNNFRYKSGQYMYLKCSAVSSLEWHPFSITSAPGDDHLSVHIRGIGDWTKELLSKFSEVCNPHLPGGNRLIRADPTLLNNIPNFPKIVIDGPYGAPSQDYKNFEVVLLVGLGIGATPMISIVKDIFNNLKGNGDEEEGRGSNRNHHMVTPRISPARKREMFRTKRAYFYWSTKEQGTLDWFKNVMDEVAETHCNNVIELHNYCTGVYEAADARSTVIAMLQSLNHAKNGMDVVSGTRVMANFARPNWENVFKRIALKHPNTRVGVFYCGTAGPAKDLQGLAMNFSHNTSTKFCFHKEIS